MKRSFARVLCVVLLGLLVLQLSEPETVWACACGCGVFEVGTRSMFPTREGGMVWTEYDYQNQNKNWSGSSPSNADNNPDKNILTQYFTVGAQYMFNNRWGIGGEVPYASRYLKTTEDKGDVVGFDHSAFGDVRLRGLYTGFSPNMASGISFGLKLPTGDYTYPHFDPDTSIGTGSTDLLLGAYHVGEIPGSNWDWFVNAQGVQPIINASGYRPGSEIDAVLGSYYDGWKIGPVKIAPLAQVVGTHRWSDSGTLSDAPNSGYSRILIAPGIEFGMARFKIYTDVGFPVYQDVTGNQLVASQYYKLNISYHF